MCHILIKGETKKGMFFGKSFLCYAWFMRTTTGWVGLFWGVTLLCMASQAFAGSVPPVVPPGPNDGVSLPAPSAWIWFVFQTVAVLGAFTRWKPRG